MNRRELKFWIGASLVALNAMSLFLIVTLPTEGGRLREFKPRVEALAPYKHWGCGLYSMSHCSSTTFYPKLKADGELRKKIHDDMIAQGYEMHTSEYGISYVRTSGALSPYRSYVGISKEGRVTTGASHSKWPRLLFGS